MVDSKSKKTITKLGKLFGVLSNNLTQLNTSKEELSVENGVPKSENKNGTSSPLKYTYETELSPTDLDDKLFQQENDVVPQLPKDIAAYMNIHNSGLIRSPSPKLTSRSSTPNSNLNTRDALQSPLQSLISGQEIVHPQPIGLDGVQEVDISKIANGNTIRSPPISRTSSVNNKRVGAPQVKSNPVSRSSSLMNKNQVGGKETPANLSTASLPYKPRFMMLENGNHEHNLKSAKRQEKLSNMLKDLMGGKKLRDEAKSAVPNILQKPASPTNKEKPPTLFAGLVSQVKNNTSPYYGPLLGPSEQQDSRSFVEKYGRCQEVIGRGSFGVVRVSHKKVNGGNGNYQNEEVLYAVKEFKRKPNESEKAYNRRLTSEFCISSSLKNINIIDTLDLLKDAKGDYCEVMEYCPGGDLYTLIIASGKLEYAEADCFFKQLIRGVNYMHDVGVSHRDLKPENLLLSQNGVLKITDFGNGECFKMAWENDVQLSEGICGSSPYIAPEEFTQTSFDPRCVDIWSCGVIYMAMRTGRQLWKLADPKRDEFFQEYLLKRKDASGYDPIESLKRARCRNVIYSILDPKPERRITGKQILNSEWGREIKVCNAAEGLC